MKKITKYNYISIAVLCTVLLIAHCYVNHCHELSFHFPPELTICLDHSDHNSFENHFILLENIIKEKLNLKNIEFVPVSKSIFKNNYFAFIWQPPKIS